MSDRLTPRDIVADTLMHQHGTIPSKATYDKTDRVLGHLTDAGWSLVGTDDLAEMLVIVELSDDPRLAATWRARYGVAE